MGLIGVGAGLVSQFGPKTRRKRKVRQKFKGFKQARIIAFSVIHALVFALKSTRKVLQ
jgi:hypothetical protein